MELPAFAHTILTRLENAGFSAWVVGGCVRDSLQGQCPHDWDFTTSARPEQMIQIFSDLPVYLTGVQHGTITLGIDGNLAEITTYRAECEYSDGRRPDKVQFLDDVRPDLARRDFTMNAIAYHPKRGMYDPFGGIQDIEKQQIRAVGNPDQRFCEDALRILRGVRFVAKTGFSIVPQTWYAMLGQLDKLECIAQERIFVELNGILMGRYVGRALREYREVIGAVLPELTPMFGLCQHNPHHKYDVWEHTVRALEVIPANDIFRWTMLFHDSGKPYTYTIDGQGVGHFYGHPKQSCVLAKQALHRLRASKALCTQVLKLIELHDCMLCNRVKPLRRQLSRMGQTTIRQLLAVKKADYTGQQTFPIHLAQLQEVESLVNEICQSEQCLSLRDLALNGHEIAEMGFVGSQIGKVLKYLLESVLEEQVENTPQALKNWVLDWKEKNNV